jgi:hypothetical protein
LLAKRLALEQIVMSNRMVTDNASLDGYVAAPTRPAIAPENRAPPERPADGVGFAEKLK